MPGASGMCARVRRGDHHGRQGRIAGFLKRRTAALGWEVSMQTMVHSLCSLAARRTAAAATRVARTSVVLAAAVLLVSVPAQAQEVTTEFAEGNLAPAADEMANAGVDGSAGSLADLIAIAQRHGFGYGISPDEVRQLLGGGYLAVRQIDCRSLSAQTEAAQRLSRTLSKISWLYAAGAGLTWVAPPVAGALGFGALVSGIGATVAGWMAADFRVQQSQVKCTDDGGIEWFRPAARRLQAAVDPAIFRFSWRPASGA